MARSENPMGAGMTESGQPEPGKPGMAVEGPRQRPAAKPRLGYGLGAMAALLLGAWGIPAQAVGGGKGTAPTVTTVQGAVQASVTAPPDDHDDDDDESDDREVSWQEAMDAVRGEWLVSNKEGIFDVGPCSATDRRLCGWIIGLKYRTPQPPRDYWGRSECGLGLLMRFNKTHSGRWVGHILDPRTGRIYQATVWRNKKGQMELHGYIGLPIFGQTEIWTRFKGPEPGAQCKMDPNIH
ncbi:DUF2147 domain-containing protein [Formicincola oecophyllae]|uniref:DUF2147 domain-containing protein n=1 Tax=Formicincola oecophyllae TaxID=2558361 RepID=A0A4Y6U914_9PROT|nr:DUF2147 domain-containing protein [Formicincola oecophyllae]QDH12946.1 DUF2147 domain-containing protein [Formicincola oecophyllae]